MITFFEAMLITQGDVEGQWEQGTLYILPEGLENKTHFAVSFGAREWLVGKDQSYLFADIPVAFVDKETGELRLEAKMFSWDRLERMTKVALTKAEIDQFAVEAAK